MPLVGTGSQLPRQALAAEELALVLGALDVAVTVRDPAGRRLYANPASARVLGLPDAEAVTAHAPGDLLALYDVYSEEGRPLSLHEFPGSRAMAGEADPPPLLVRNVIKATGEERWLLNQARAVLDAAGNVELVIDLMENVTASKRAEIAQRLFAHVARQAAGGAELSEVFETIAREAVPGLADWAGVDVLTPGGQIETVAVAHLDPAKVRLGWRLRTEWPVGASDPTGLAAVIRTGEPDLVPDITDEMLTAGARDPEHLAVLRAVGLNSTMIVPIRVGERILGALNFVSSTSRRFDRRDVELACDLGTQLGVLILGERLHAERARIARILQAGLIPAELPAVAGWEVSGAYRAAGMANDAGGDFYEVVRFDGGAAAIIGDVLGKGAEAASLTALARHTVAAIIEATHDVPHSLAVLNRRLRERGDDFRSLCTLAVAVLDPDGTATLYSAGHPLPLLAGAGAVRAVGQAGPMLGFLDTIAVPAHRLRLASGERIVLYTDGVLDALGADQRFGERRLNAAVQAAVRDGEGPLAEAVLNAVESFTAGEQSDDMAVLSLTRST